MPDSTELPEYGVARRATDLAVGIYTAAMTRKSVTLPLGMESPFYNGVTIEDYCRSDRLKVGENGG